LWAGSRLDEALGLRARNDFKTIVGGLSEDESRFLDLSAARRDKQTNGERRKRNSVIDKQVWESAKGQQLFVISETGSEVAVVRIAFNPDCRPLAACVGKLIKISDAASGNELLTPENDAEVRSLAFTLDGKHLAAVDEDWTVRLHP